MEFKFRALDEAPPPPPITTAYPTTVTYISHRSLRGMIPSPRHNSFPMPMNSTRETLRRELEKEQIRREIIAGEIERRRELEEEVRRELALERGWGMAMAETSHGFSFEERVSMMRLNPSSYLFNHNARSQPQLSQLMPPAELKPYLETNNDNVIKLGPVKYMSPSLYRLDTTARTQSQLPQLMAPADEFKPSPETNNDKLVTLGSVKFSSPGRYQFDNNNNAWPQPPLAQLMAPGGEFKPSLETNNEFVKQGSVKFPSPGQYQFANNAWSHPQLPELRAPAEFKPYEETNKDKVIKLAKPDPDRYVAKRKAVTPDVDRNDHFPSSLKKKPKEDWSCAVCKVSATSEKGLKDHLQGKKHKAKEIALRKKKIFKNTNTSISSKKSEKSVKSNQLMHTTTSGLDAKADRQPLQSSVTCGGINQTMAGKGAVESKNEEHFVQKNLKSEPMYTTTLGLGTKANSLPIQPSFISWMDINQTVASKGAVESKNEEQLGPKNVNSNESMDATATSVLDAKADKLPVQPNFATWEDINHTTADKCAVESKNKEQLVPKNVKSESMDTTETSRLGAKTDRLTLQPTFKTCGDINKIMSHKGMVKSNNEEQVVQKNVKSNEPMDNTTTSGLNTKADRLQFQPSFSPWGDIYRPKADKAVVDSKNGEQPVQNIAKSNEPIDTTTLGLDAKTDKPSLQPSFITWGDIAKTMANKGAVESKNAEQPVHKNVDGLKNENRTINEQGGKKALKRKKMKFWCETCQVGAPSQVVMESHKKGKKHLARMKTSSVSVEAPELIKGTDGKQFC
ncbi:PREDICTED: uncharacterized protein LOC109355062 isoform X3 [Lupinus angustifolius]|uniref:uncharacterized protein LOC109355062 isoform X3 n=1 Tax=Lupinus angustifolius TaxID=3871 RepID=UPI00092EE732|nr:PREDICTED: uncharacterized protein LOC109355062 isoform X3 [Lupinus angustifolius]